MKSIFRLGAAAILGFGCATAFWLTRSPAVASSDPPRATEKIGDLTYPADPVIVYGPDGVTPIYVEDPVDEQGVPVPRGPQHERHVITLPMSEPRPAGPRGPMATAEDLARMEWGPENYQSRVDRGLPVVLPHHEEMAARPPAESTW